MAPITDRDANVNYWPADPRLGRLPEFDTKSLEFPIRELMTAAQVRTPRSKTWNMRQRLNQGSQPKCVGYSIAQEVGGQPYYNNVTDFLADLIYQEAQKIDYWPGEGYAGTSVLAGMTIAKKLGLYKEFRWALPGDPLLDTVLAVGYQGPVVCGTDWYSGMSNPVNGLATVSGSHEGGHAYVLGAVNVPGKYFTIFNTWGDGYGVGGNARLSFADLEKLIYANGEIALPVTRTT